MSVSSPEPSCKTPAMALLLSRKRPESVTHVSGMNCYPLVRKGIKHLPRSAVSRPDLLVDCRSSRYFEGMALKYDGTAGIRV